MTEWISVKDKLPDVAPRCCTDVLIRTTHSEYTLIGAYSGDGQWFQFAGFSHIAPRIHMVYGDQIGHQSVYSIPSEKVTHWMEIPYISKPKELSILATLIDDLVFAKNDKRIKNCIKAENIETIGDLIKYGLHELNKTPNLGRKSIDQIKITLHGLGIDFE